MSAYSHPASTISALRPAKVLVAILMLVFPKLAMAAWPHSGVLVSDSASTVVNALPVAAADESGVYVTWQSASISAGQLVSDPGLQRLTFSGAVATGWPTEARKVTTAPDDQLPWVIVSDGLGGVYIVWDDFRNFSSNGYDIYALRVLADGTNAPGWPVDGLAIAVKPGNQRLTHSIADGSGGLYISWDDENPRPGELYDAVGLHVLSSGDVASGWPANGKPLAPTAGDQGRALLAPDGNGGVFITYVSLEPEANIYSRHLDATGELVPGWPAADVAVTLAARNQAGHRVCPATDGFFITWIDDRSRPEGTSPDNDYYDIYAQHLLADGAIAPGWPADGLPVCVLPDIQQFPRLVPDGEGGIVVVWEDLRTWANGFDLYGARIGPDGVRAPGWPENGRPIMAGSQSHQVFDIAPDGMGGVYTVAEAYPVGQNWIQHTMGNGEPEIGWPLTGQPITPGISGQEYPRVVWDGYLGAYVVWDDARYGNTHVFAKHYGPDGPTSIAVSLVSAEAEPGLVRLAWQVTGGTGAFTLERRRDGVLETTASLSPDGSGRITYEDRTPEPARYFYRLTYLDDGIRRETPEVLVDVPSAHVLSLAGFRPNPSSSASLSVAFTLPKQAPGSITLFDVAGRQVAREGLNSLGPGRHVLRIVPHNRMPAGVYWLRLTHGERVLTARGVVAR
jgi:hypothetical protein